MVRATEIEVKELGYHFGKRDLDRVGYFDDTTAGHFGEYKNDSSIFQTKGKQFKAGQPGDYFDKKFKRLFEGENSKELRDNKIKEKPVGRYIVPTSPTKFHSTPNDWFGCIGKPISYLSPAEKIDKKKPTPRLPNFKIKPSPLGGPGYVNICLNPYPKYFSGAKKDGLKNLKKGEKPGKFLSAIKGPDYFLSNPYLELNPGPTYVNSKNKKFKTIGEKKFYVSFPKDSGCFSKFPEYVNENDRRREEKKQNKHGSVSKFILGGFNSKSKYTFSIIDRVTQVSCNANNFLEYQQRVYPL